MGVGDYVQQHCREWQSATTAYVFLELKPVEMAFGIENAPKRNYRSLKPGIRVWKPDSVAAPVILNIPVSRSPVADPSHL
jgi:hypothetical protein